MIRSHVSTWLWLGAALLAGACGGGDSPPVDAGISRSTPVATARPASDGASVTPTAAATAGGALPAPADPAFARWADAVCASTARFDDDVAAIQDGIDPTTLALPDRITRAQTRYRIYIDALAEQAKALAAITPPPAVEPYQAALRTQVSELDRLFTERIALLGRVVIASDIDDATATLQGEVEKLENSLALVRSLVPDAADAALDSPLRCGEILG